MLSSEKNASLDERRKQVAKYWGTMSAKKLAEKLGVSIGTINNDIRYLKAYGIIDEDTLKERVTAKKRKKEEARLQQVASLYGKINYAEMAQKLGVSVNIILKDVETLKKRGTIESTPKRVNVMSSKNRERIEERRRQVVSLLGKATIPEIAKQLGVSPATVNNDIRWLREQGIDSLDDFNAREQTQIQVQEDAHEEAKQQVEYVSMMIFKVKKYYEQGKIELAIECLETIKDKIDFSDENSKKYQEIMRRLQERKKETQGNGQNQITKDGSRQASQEPEDAIEIS